MTEPDKQPELSREEALLERGIEATREVRRSAVRWWHHLRFLLFVFYLLFAVVVFWLGVVRVALRIVRTLLKGVIRLLQLLGGGGPNSKRIHRYPEAPVELWVREDAVRWWHHFRFILFALYLVVAAVGFWIWLVATALNGIRLLSSGIGLFFAWLAGAGEINTWGAIPASTQRLWSNRMKFYRDGARPLARAYVSTRRTSVHFWHWGGAHKLAAIVATLTLVVLPSFYIVPRPHTVRILDDNVLQHLSTPNGAMRYLIHAEGLNNPNKLYEYENERAVHLGKIDPQGLKNYLVPGRYYRLWVIGIRWPWLPTLFPNIVSATEVDENGEKIQSRRAVAETASVLPDVP